MTKIQAERSGESIEEAAKWVKEVKRERFWAYVFACALVNLLEDRR
jgi:S-methylmethionine-dependent homocysteine/selenocysteine methylase